MNSSLTNLLVNENEKLAIQLQVEDEESDEAFGSSRGMVFPLPQIAGWRHLPMALYSTLKK